MSQRIEIEFTLNGRRARASVRPQDSALKLLREAGWQLRDQKLVNNQGEPLELEILMYKSAAMERVVARGLPA